MKRLWMMMGLLLALAAGARASYPISWGNYGGHSERGYLHDWGDEWMDYSADSLAIQVKTWPVRYRTLAWVAWQNDTLHAPINRARLDSMVLAEGGALPFREEKPTHPPVEVAPVDPDIMPRGLAATFAGVISLGFAGEYLYHCNKPFCRESVAKQLISGTAATAGTIFLTAGIYWIVKAVREAE